MSFVKKNLPFVLLASTMLFWGSAFVGSKVVVGEVPPAVGGFFRFALGAFFMLVFLLSTKKGRADAKAVTKKDIGIIVVLGVCGVFLYNLCFFWGLKFSYSSDGSSIVPTLSPVFTTIFAMLFLRNLIAKQQFIGFAICLFGAVCYFLGMDTHVHGAENRLLGDLFFVLCACCWGFYTMLGTKVLNRLAPLAVTAYATLTGAALLGVTALPELVTLNWSDLSGEFWLLQLYLGFFCTTLANWFYSVGVKSLGASKAAVFMYFVPINGLWMSIVMLGESLTWMQFVAVGMMIMGVWFVNKRPKKPAVMELSKKHVG